ncbi:MAG: tRNA glutamyl-Q(34) synthetase GluQRS [Methylophilus sp.]|nr:tRNA glutamyl-Q(34) synthetase GluQRS [Methylophilus sp.]
MNAYVGRFAPSPTGPLHFGSLVAAVASYCDAKANQGQWLIRIEDLDKPREMAGASQNILSTLEAFGFAWDGSIIYQSQRTQAYEEAFFRLQEMDKIYGCICSRKEIADSAVRTGIEGAIYPKTCLQHPPIASKNMAYRVMTENRSLSFVDHVQGVIHQNLAQDIGDFVLKRADGIFAYQLAVVVDDAYQNITHIVRGSDLLNSTTRQLYLQQLLGLKTPCYAHIPIVVNEQGEKLSKQTLAEAIESGQANQQLYLALKFLGQNPPLEIKKATLSDLWQWAVTNWRIANVPQTKALFHAV